MTTWTLTTEQAGNPAHSVSGDATNRADAVAALVAITRDQMQEISERTRYTLQIDAETIAMLVSGDDDAGRPDIDATVELLDRINLTDNVGPLIVE